MMMFDHLDNSANAVHTYAMIAGEIESNTDGSEGGELDFYTADTGDGSLDLAMRIDSEGIVRMPTVYSHDMNGETMRDLQINDSGELGYDSSSRATKMKAVLIKHAPWLYELRTYEYERKKNPGKKEIGLFAEELAEVRPELVYYDGDTPVGVHYKGLIVPMLAEIQNLKREIEELKRST